MRSSKVGKPWRDEKYLTGFLKFRYPRFSRPVARVSDQKVPQDRRKGYLPTSESQTTTTKRPNNDIQTSSKYQKPAFAPLVRVLNQGVYQTRGKSVGREVSQNPWKGLCTAFQAPNHDDQTTKQRYPNFI